jgi:hypothetical protein
MFAAFEKEDCAQRQHKSALYDAEQAQFFNNRILADSTSFRCFKDPVVESKLWRDSYATRNYTKQDCDMSLRRPEPSCLFRDATPLGQAFNIVNKDKKPLYDNNC